jgi:hypothetical protein
MHQIAVVETGGRYIGRSGALEKEIYRWEIEKRTPNN